MTSRIFNKNWLTAKLTRGKLGKFICRYRNNGLTLDIGCAYSPYMQYFPNRIGLDIKKWPSVDVVADAHNLPFENEKFENILCSEVLEHLHSPQIAISEMKRVLKKGGRLILTTRFIFPLHDAPNDLYRYTKYGLAYLFKDGWEIIECEAEASSQQTIAILIQRIAFQSKFRGVILDSIIKIFLLLIAKVIYYLPFFSKKEYGDILKKEQENSILSSGYYLVCQKK